MPTINDYYVAVSNGSHASQSDNCTYAMSCGILAAGYTRGHCAGNTARARSTSGMSEQASGAARRAARRRRAARLLLPLGWVLLSGNLLVMSGWLPLWRPSVPPPVALQAEP